MTQLRLQDRANALGESESSLLHGVCFFCSPRYTNTPPFTREHRVLAPIQTNVQPSPSQACAGCGSIQSTTLSTQFTQSTQSTTQSTTRSATQSPQSPTDDTAALDRQSDSKSCPAPEGDIEDLEARVLKLDLQPTTQSRQQLQAAIFELEQRPTIQSHTLLQDKIVDLDRYYSTSSVACFLRRQSSIKGRPTQRGPPTSPDPHRSSSNRRRHTPGGSSYVSQAG
jgi:hypothetical protein